MQNPKQKNEQEKRDAEIISLYPNLTIREIAEKYGLTHVRVWQIIKRSKVAK